MLACAGLGGCLGQDDSIENLIEYSQEHRTSLEQAYEGKELRSTLKYLPPDMVAYRDYELLGDEKVSFEDYKKGYQSTAQFELRLYDKNIAGIQERIKEHESNEFIAKYYNYQMQGDLKLVQGGDTLDCVNYHPVQLGGSTNHLLFLCDFDLDLSKTKGDISVLYFDRIFGQEIMSHRFETQVLNQVPTIKK